MLIGKQQRVALHGLGGVGKTQIALSLSYWTRENLPEYSVFWLSALSMANFEQSCRDIVEDISLPCLQSQSPHNVLRSFLSSEESGVWLLVIDNLDDESIAFGPGGISSCLPKPRDKRSLVVFTTRSRKIAREISNFNIIQLQEMDKDEARILLETLLGPDRLQDKGTTIASLLEELTYLPLAINHAAAYIDQNGISAKAYVDLMGTSERDLVELLGDNFSQEGSEGKSQNAVATTWLLSFESIRSSDPQAGVLLEFLSQIEPKSIPWSILPKFETKQQQIRAIGTLSSYAFINERSNEMFDMHSLVNWGAKVWVERQGQEYTKKVIESCVTRLTAIFHEGEENRLEAAVRFGNEYLPHALKLLRASDDLGMNCELRVDFCELVGNVLLFVRRRPCPEGTRLLRQALQLAENGNFHERILPLQTKEAWRILEDSSETCLGVDHTPDPEEIERGIKLAESAVEAYKLTSSVDHLSLFVAQIALAGLYILTDRQKDAIPLVDSALETFTTDSHDSYRFIMAPQLALRLREIDRISTAIDVLERTIERHDAVVRRCTPELVMMHLQLAMLYFFLDDDDIQGLVGRCEHTWKLAMDCYRQVSNLQVLQVQTMLGLAYNWNGQHAEATKVLNEVVELCEKDTALTDWWYAIQARSNLAEYAEAELDVAEGAKAGNRGNVLLRISARFKVVTRRLIWIKKRGEKGLRKLIHDAEARYAA